MRVPETETWHFLCDLGQCPLLPPLLIGICSCGAETANSPGPSLYHTSLSVEPDELVKWTGDDGVSLAVKLGLNPRDAK